MAVIEQDHIFVDTETSNTNPDTGCIISLAAIRTDSRGKVLASYFDKIIPDREVSPEAAKVNGYCREDWGSAVSFKTAIRSFNNAMVQGESDKAIFVAHFADFDRRFISVGCQRHGAEIPLNTRAWVCTGNLIWPFLFNRQIKSRKLSDACEFFGVEHKNAHTAIGDVQACMLLYFEIMRRYSTMLLVHTAAHQSAGGGILRGIEKLVSGY